MSNRRSKKQEKEIAKDLEGGFVQPASGAIWCFPNDVCSECFLVEAKYTDNKSFSLQKSYLRKLVETALKKAKLPALIVQFDPEGEKYAVIRYAELLALDEMLSNYDN